MFILTRSSAPKRFAKFGWQTRTFCHKKWKKRMPNSSQTDYSRAEHTHMRQLRTDCWVIDKSLLLPGIYLTGIYKKGLLYYLYSCVCVSAPEVTGFKVSTRLCLATMVL